MTTTDNLTLQDATVDVINLPQLNSKAAFGQWGGALSRFFSKSASNAISDYKISKENLNSCRVVSQVGNKFILVVLSSFSGQHLLIIDQHAADERVKFEYYLRELTLQNLRHTASSLATPVVLPITQSEEEILKLYAPAFAPFGISYDLVNANDNHELIVTHLPEVVHKKLLAEKNHSVNIDFIRRLLVEHARDIHDKKASRFPVSHEKHWTVSIQSYPAALVGIYKSKACRDAIKFGDKIDISQCENLVRELSECIFPFQCAHGRPSMIPLVDLSRADAGI